MKVILTRFLLLFERVARARDWPDADCALMLQCVLTGRAQSAYSSLCLEDSSSYSKIKSAVLRAYELVPEAYRQRFRSFEQKQDQTYVEMARDLSVHFKCWLTALDITTFDDLCELMTLEQFKNITQNTGSLLRLKLLWQLMSLCYFIRAGSEGALGP